MNIRFSARAGGTLPTERQPAASVDPSEKYDESNDVWQGRVNRDYRFYFQIVADDYVIVRIIPHPK